MRWRSPTSKKKEPSQPRILWCALTRCDGTILAEAESILSRQEEQAVIETAEQLLAQEKLPRRVGKLIETTQEFSSTTPTKAIQDFVLRPHQGLRRRRQVPLEGMLLAVAGGKKPKRKKKGNRRKSRATHDSQRLRLSEDTASSIMIAKGEGSSSKKAKRRGSNATASTVDADDCSDNISTISCKSSHDAMKATSKSRKPRPTLFVSAVYNPLHCKAENVKIFLGAIAAAVVELEGLAEDEIWLEATELGLQGTMAPVMAKWMADVSYLITLAHVQEKVDRLTAQMQENLEAAWRNTADAEELHDMSLDLLDKSLVFKKKSSNLRQQKKNRNLAYAAAIGASATSIVGISLLIAFV